jgi:hypothetical protein
MLMKRRALAVLTALALVLGAAATPAEAFPGRGKLRKAWKGIKKAYRWVDKKMESGKNQERARERGR